MPANFTPGDQIAFLVACARHSADSKPNWPELTKDLGTDVTVDALQKRYYRILAKYANGNPNTTNDTAESPKKKSSGGRKKGTAKAKENKKRKIEEEPKEDEETVKGDDGTGEEVTGVSE